MSPGRYRGAVVSAADLWSFVAVAAVIVAVPGPSVLFVISRSVAYGRVVGLQTVLGNAIGAGVQVLLISLGLGAIIERSLVVFTALKIVGACYLVWLGWCAWRDRRSLADLASRPPEVHTTRRVVSEGFVVGVTNPKLFVFAAAVLPQFVDRSAGSVGLQLGELGLVFVAIALVFDSVWAMAAGSARDWLARSPDRLAAVGGVGGLVTMGLGVRLAFLGRHD